MAHRVAIPVFRGRPVLSTDAPRQRRGSLMTAHPALSVIIPTFNGAAHLASQLSALAGEVVRGDFEVVIADNGSNDDTQAIASSFTSALALVMVDASDTIGQSFARNVGVASAAADKLVFLDQDDVVAPGYLERISTALDEHQAVAARIETTTLNPHGMDRVRQVAQSEGLPTDPVPWAYGCTLGVTRFIFEELGGFAVDQVGGAEDVDFCWRLHDSGVQLAFVPEAVLRYRFPTTYGALFGQGRRYGYSAIAVYARRGQRNPRSSLDAWVRGFAWALASIVGSLRRPDRGRAVFLLGRRVGELEAETHYRVAGRN